MDALIADDNIALSKALHWALKRIVPDGWDIRVTNDAVTAGYLLILDPGLKVAVVDYLMPIRDGEHIVTEAMKVRPHLRGKIIICSGLDEYPPEVEHHLFVDLGCRKLPKPVNFDELETMVLDIIGPQ